MSEGVAGTRQSPPSSPSMEGPGAQASSSARSGSRQFPYTSLDDLKRSRRQFRNADAGSSVPRYSDLGLAEARPNYSQFLYPTLIAFPLLISIMVVFSSGASLFSRVLTVFLLVLTLTVYVCQWRDVDLTHLFARSGRDSDSYNVQEAERKGAKQ